jgi:thiamine-phosphate pyrophosphorylase
VRAPLDPRRLGPVYAIADADALEKAGTPLPAVPAAVAAMAGAGIRTIQLRAKGRSGAEQHRLLAECLAVLAGSAGSDVDLWMDDRVDLAALLPVCGVHLGQRDLPPQAARRVVGEALWIGLSTHDEEQLAAAALDPAVDLVAVGPVFPTASKERPDSVVGLDFVRRARQLSDKPLVAIGGIGPGNIADVLAAGADAAVALSAVCCGGPDAIAAGCRHLLECASS